MGSGRVLRKCCCFELETGVMIIGYLGGIGLLLSMTGSYSEFSMNRITSQSLAARLVLSFIHLLIYVSLIHGTTKKDRYLLLPWLILNYLLAILTGFFLVVSFIILIIYAYDSKAFTTSIFEDNLIFDERILKLSTSVLVLWFVLCCILYAISIYILMVVYSLYVKFKGSRLYY